MLTLALLSGLGVVTGCDTESELPDDLVGPSVDMAEVDETDDDDGALVGELSACESLGADRSCGPADEHIQFCAWLYNDETREVATYWGECVPEPECSLWACRETDGALCDLVDGRPQWVAESCDW